MVTHEVSQALCQRLPIQSPTLTLSIPRDRFSDNAHLTDKDSEARRWGENVQEDPQPRRAELGFEATSIGFRTYALYSVVEDVTGWGAGIPLQEATAARKGSGCLLHS